MIFFSIAFFIFLGICYAFHTLATKFNKGGTRILLALGFSIFLIMVLFGEDTFYIILPFVIILYFGLRYFWKKNDTKPYDEIDQIGKK